MSMTRDETVALIQHHALSILNVTYPGALLKSAAEEAETAGFINAAAMRIIDLTGDLPKPEAA